MKPVCRWPLHPAPVEGESLSSWLSRIAHCYDLTLAELLVHDLGYASTTDLDIDPPQSLLAIIASRSGVNMDRVRIMSMAGWVPWLLDRLDRDEQVSSAFEVYVQQCSVLMLEKSRQPRILSYWLPWMPLSTINRACPLCLQAARESPLMLMWQMPLMLSCPQHGCLLKTYPDNLLLKQWMDLATDIPESADDDVKSMDRRTWQALTVGFVDLPRHRIHAGLWFRLLRTLLDEVNIPISFWPAKARDLRLIWDISGLPFRAGQSIWKPFEYLSLMIQIQMLKAVAVAMRLIEHNVVDAQGTEALLFRPEPVESLSDGQPFPSVPDYWYRVKIAVDEAVADAKVNPKTARDLLRLMTLHAQSEAEIDRARDALVELSIPVEFLSL